MKWGLRSSSSEDNFKRKIRWGFSASLLVALLITLLSIQAIVSIRREKNAVIYDKGQALLLSKDLLSLFESRSASGRAYLLTGEENFLVARRTEGEDFRQKINELKPRVDPTETLPLLNRIEAADKEYEEMAGRMIHLRQTAKEPGDIVQFFEEQGLPVRTQLRADLDLLVDQQKRLFETARDEATRASGRILFSFVVLATLSILLAFVLSWVFSRILSRLYRSAQDALERLQSSEALTERIVESALDAVISMDRHGNILDFNPAAEKIFGYDREKVIGKEMAELIIPPSLRESHRRGLQRFFETGEGRIMNRRIEMPAIRSDGSEFLVELSVTHTFMSGEPLFTAFIRDITERKRIEDEKTKAIQARDELVAVVSHELKNPLSAIETSAELVLRKIPQRGEGTLIGRSLERIKNSVNRMNRLTSDLLDVTKVEAGRLSLLIEPHDLPTLIEDALVTAHAAAAQRKIRLQRDLSPEVHQVYCDRDRVVQVLSNLIGNAVKFSPESASVLVRTSRRDGEALIEVEDHGHGIEPEHIGKIFDRFWQAKQTAFTGVGLGLSISKGIIELHGGKIWVESQVGVGTRIYFTLKTSADSVKQLTAAS